MNGQLSPIVSVSDLEHMYTLDNVVLLDSRYPNGKEKYINGHLSGALFVDVDHDLADIQSDFKYGGRHPMPKVEKFIPVLNRLGITPDSHVVIYDDASGAFASRMWWMLRSLGHENVQILDGGFTKAVTDKFPIQSGEEFAKSTSNYPPTNWNLPMVDMEGVKRVSNDEKSVLVDVREDFRYRGESEPIDLIAGHIPGAINIPFRTNLDENGLFLRPEKLAEKYEVLFQKHDEVVFYCGSGVTACHGILAALLAGLPIAKLYVGSWSEWSRNDQPIGRK